MKSNIDLIIVAYNEAGAIEEVLRTFYAEVSKHANVQIIVAEDGSSDGTRDILERLSGELPVKLVLAEERRGYTRAVGDAIAAATNDTILFMDADGQYLPEDFDNLYNLWKRLNSDMIIGEKITRQDAPHRRFLSWIYNLIIRIFFKVKFKDMNCSYRFIKKDLAQSIAPKCKFLPYSYWTELTIRAHWAGYKISAGHIRHRDRLAGESRIYPPSKLLAITLKQIKGLRALHKEIVSGS